MSFFSRLLGLKTAENEEDYNREEEEKEKASRAKSKSKSKNNKNDNNNKNNNNNNKQDKPDPSATKREDDGNEHNGEKLSTKYNNGNNSNNSNNRKNIKSKHNNKNNENDNNNYNNDLYRNNHGWTRKNRKAMHERTARAKEETSTFLGQLGTLRNPIPTLAKAAGAITLFAFQRPGGGTVLADSSHAVAVQGSDAVAMPVVAVVPPDLPVVSVVPPDSSAVSEAVAVVESPDGGSMVPLFQAPQPQSFPEDAPQEQQPMSSLNGGPASAAAAAAAAAASAASAGAAAAAGSGGFSYALMGITGTVHSFVKALFEGGKDIIDSILHKGIAALVVVSLIALCAVAFLANVLAGAILTSLVAIGVAIAYFFFKQETTGEKLTSKRHTKDNKDKKHKTRSRR